MRCAETAKARALRRASPWAERLLWKHLRNRRLAGHKFRRQQPLGPYVLDFFCAEKGLAVELDGGQHNDSEPREHDRRRDGYLSEHGVRTLRFYGQLRDNLEGVLERIRIELRVDQ